MTEGTISGFPQDLAGLVSNRVASRSIDSTSTNSILSAPCATYHHCDARALAGEGTSRASPQARISSFITFSQDQLVPLQTQYAANSVPYNGMSGALGEDSAGASAARAALAEMALDPDRRIFHKRKVVGKLRAKHFQDLLDEILMRSEGRFRLHNRCGTSIPVYFCEHLSARRICHRFDSDRCH